VLPFFLSLKTLIPGFLFVVVEYFTVLHSKDDTVPTLLADGLTTIVPLCSLLALGYLVCIRK